MSLGQKERGREKREGERDGERRESKEKERERRQTEDLIYPSLGLMSGQARERERERIMGVQAREEVEPEEA